MEIKNRNMNKWIRNTLIPHLADVFREKCDYRNIDYKITLPRGSYFLSDLFFATIQFPKQQRRVVVKLPSQKLTNLSPNDEYAGLFTNEILFYNHIAGDNREDYPMYYLGGQDSTFKYVIVLENVNDREFFICTKKINVHLDYVIAGLRSMAKFHSSTYRIKEKTPEKFRHILKNLKNVRYDTNFPYLIYVENVNCRIQRVTKMLRQRKGNVEFTEKIANLFQNCYGNVLMKCVKPVEPLATVIHGDCTINNLLFKKFKTNENEHLKAMLLDFGLLMYSSPAIDVATYIYMCSSRADIREFTKDLFKDYHKTLSENMKDQNIWDPHKYSFEAFWTDYRKRAIFGYVIAAFFLPLMTEYESNYDILDMSDEKVNEINLTGGGEALSNLLVDMLIDMQEAGLLDSYVNNNSVDIFNV